MLTVDEDFGAGRVRRELAEKKQDLRRVLNRLRELRGKSS